MSVLTSYIDSLQGEIAHSLIVSVSIYKLEVEAEVSWWVLYVPHCHVDCAWEANFQNGVF